MAESATPHAAPRLSAVVVARDGFHAVRTTVRHLAAQTSAAEIEVVLVATSRRALAPDEAELTAFAGWKVVEAGTTPSDAFAYAAGVRGASAPVVLFCEDHCFPEPGHAAALLARHDEGWAVVAPVVANANTRGAIAWADFLLGYGPWLPTARPGERDFLPGHNSSYKRDALLAYEPELETWLQAEAVLQWDLRDHGHRLYLEPGALTHHFNFSRARPWLTATFLSSRTFAGRRVACAGVLRRLAYTAATPLIPLVRVRRLLRDTRSWERQPSPRVLASIALALLVSAAGEAAGYSLGAGAAPSRVANFEYRRDRHMNARDRVAFAAARFF